MSFLRRALGDRGAICARPPGYCPDVSDEATDVQTAERLICREAGCADPHQGAQRREGIRQAVHAAGLDPATALVDVDLPPPDIADSAAADLLLDEARPGHQHHEILLRPTLVIRASTAEPATPLLSA